MARNSADRLSNSIAQGAKLEEMLYKDKAAMPKKGDVYAQTFSDIAKSFSAPGDRPRGALRSLGAGLAKGAETGARLNSVEERKGDYDKYENVMNYFREANDAAIEQNQWHETRENAKRDMMPQVLAYMDNIDRLDPQSQRIMAQDMLAQYGNQIGENFKLSSIDGSNPYLMTIQSDKGQQLFDLRSMFAGDEAMQGAIAMKMPEYQLRLQQEREDKKKKFEFMQDELDIKKFDKGIPGGKFGTKAAGLEGESDNTFEYSGNVYDVVPLNGLEKTEKSNYGITVNKAVAQIPTNENSLKALHNMREVFERNPNIGESYVNMLSSGADEDTWGRYIAKKFTSRQERADMEILKKNSNDLNLSTVLSVPGKSATDLLKQVIQAAAPTGTLTKQGFDKVASELEERAMNNIDMAKAQAYGRTRGLMIISRKKDSGMQPQAMGSNVVQAGGSQENDIWDQLEQ